MKKFVLIRTPMRISFVGGGTDFLDYYNKYEGSVFSAAIDKYIYLAVNKYHDEKRCLLKYSKSENVRHLYEIKHPLIKHALELTKTWGLDINSIADIPSGTGLGSSSSFTVGLINALRMISGKKSQKKMLAELASKVEINLAQSPIGKQDQYAASYGGINKFIFKKNNYVRVINYDDKINYKLFLNNLLILNTGIEENNFKILSQQKFNVKKGGKYLDSLHLMKASVDQFIKYLIRDDFKSCGDIVHQNWNLKKKLSSSINNKNFDEIYKIAITNGAYGGKILGAGGRGYMLLIAPKNKHYLIAKKLPKLKILKFSFDFNGSESLFTRS